MQMLGNQWDEEPARMMERVFFDAGTPGFEGRFLARAFERGWQPIVLAREMKQGSNMIVRRPAPEVVLDRTGNIGRRLLESGHCGLLTEDRPAPGHELPGDLTQD